MGCVQIPVAALVAVVAQMHGLSRPDACIAVWALDHAVFLQVRLDKGSLLTGRWLGSITFFGHCEFACTASSTGIVSLAFLR